MRGLASAPAVHFVVLGGLLFVAGRLLDGAGSTPPGPASLAEQDLLYREAVALGLDRRDPAVRERLARLSSFEGEDDGAGRDAREREARRLGLDRSDVVVRRHLATMMRLAAGRLDAADIPTETELLAYLAAHPERFGAPPLLRLTHVYLARGRHAPADAQRLLATLRRDGAGPADGPAHGDAFLGGAEIGPASPRELDRRLGPGFADRLAGVPAGTWVGPITSAYGEHLVWIRERIPARLPAFERVRAQVLHRMLRERSEARARARLAALRARAGSDPGRAAD